MRTTQPYPFQAGQHATLESPRLPHTWRWYSMANPPSGDGILEFHVRAKGGGGLSDVLVADGDAFRVGPARGGATLGSATGDNLLLVAGGTGLAPIKSILGEVGHAVDPPRTSLFVGARSREDLYDLEPLTAYGPWHGCRAIVAGPRAMVALLLRELPELGVPEQHIVYDPE